PTASRSVPVAPAPPGAVAAIPAAPAGVGAPALSSATRLIPIQVLDEDPISVHALRQSRNGEASEEAAGSAIAPPSPPPSTAAAGGNGAGHRDSAPAPAPVFAGPATVAPPPRVALRSSGGSPGRPAPPPRLKAPSGGGGRPVGRIVAAVIAALAVVAVVVVVLVVTSSSKSSNAASSTVASSTAAKAGRHRDTAAGTKVAVTPSAVTVAVLNGTSTANLAHDVMQKLTGLGYKQGAIQTASNQSLDSTIVGYMQPADRADALAVAKSLDLGSASVQGVAAGDRTVACSATPTNCPAQVVVTVGADLASAA
ncbi:MAG: LytR C-terminal domain-containing protein, partial [Solirubrobacteraceae bacterium]